MAKHLLQLNLINGELQVLVTVNGRLNLLKIQLEAPEGFSKMVLYLTRTNLGSLHKKHHLLVSIIAYAEDYAKTLTESQLMICVMLTFSLSNLPAS